MQDGTLEKGLTELPFQFPLAPALLDGPAQVKLPFFRSLGLRQDDEIVGPGQFSHQW